MKILVLGGCGAMGTEATRDLVSYSSYGEIVIADRDLAKAKELSKLLGPRTSAIEIDVTDKKQLAAAMKPAQVVLNCTSYAFGMPITETAIEQKKPLLDLGGLYNTPKQLALTDEAKKAGITIVLGCGATPGVTNILARRGAEYLDSVDTVRVAFATFRAIAPSPGLLDTVLDEFGPDTKRFYYEDGKFVEAQAFEGELEVEFDAPVGKVPTYYVPHSETHTMPRFIGKGIRKVEVRGTWRPETMEFLKTARKYELLSKGPEFDLKGVQAGPKEALRAHLLSNPKFKDDGLPWAFYLNIQVQGVLNGRPTVHEFSTRHPFNWGTAATAKMTGIPAGIGSEFMLRGNVRETGVIAPEAAFDHDDFMAACALRGICFSEKTWHPDEKKAMAASA